MRLRQQQLYGSCPERFLYPNCPRNLLKLWRVSHQLTQGKPRRVATGTSLYLIGAPIFAFRDSDRSRFVAAGLPRQVRSAAWPTEASSLISAQRARPGMSRSRTLRCRTSSPPTGCLESQGWPGGQRLTDK